MPEYTFTIYQTDAPINVAGSSGQEVLAVYTIVVSDDDTFGIGDNDVGGGISSETGAAPTLVSGDPSLPPGWNVGDTFFFGSDRNLSDQVVEDALLYPRVNDAWQSSFFALREGSDPYQVGETLGTVTFGSNTPSVGGSSSGVEEVTPQLACFARGTLIEGDRGVIAVQDLTPGMLVRTRDNGLKSVRWIGTCTVDADEMAANPKLRPVRIAKGALGSGRPNRDLMVSRQHRVLVRSPIAQRMFSTDEVLVPAVKLIDLAGIEIVTENRCLEYFHILFDRHEVIRSDGAWTESMFAGPEGLKVMPGSASAEFGALHVARSAARHIPASGRLMKQLVARHCKNNKPLYQD